MVNNRYNNLYNKVIYSSHPVQYNTFISNQYNNIHKELFTYANKKAWKCLYDSINYYDNLAENTEDKQIYQERVKPYVSDIQLPTLMKLRNIKNLISTYEDFLHNVSIIEFGNNEYWQPSTVLWRLKTFPFTTLSIKEDNILNYTHDFWLSNNKGIMSLSYWWDKSIETFDSESLNKKYKGYEISYINYVSGKVTLTNRLTEEKIEVSFNEIRPNMKLDDNFIITNTFTDLYHKK